MSPGKEQEIETVTKIANARTPQAHTRTRDDDFRASLLLQADYP